MKKAIRDSLASLRFKLSRSNSFLFVAYYEHLYTPNPGSLSELLSRYSRDIGRDFTVIQVGANDGITHDPIHKFIKRDNWNGVLLEPQKYVFDEFLSRLYEKHDNLHVFNAAVGREDGTATLFKIGFSDSRWATGLATFDRATLERAFGSGHVERRCAKEGSSIPEQAAGHIAEEEVEVISPSTLMERFDIRRIDLLMIDAEGFDFEVIKLFDLAAARPGLIIFEHSHLSEPSSRECLALLESNDYVTRKDGANIVALKASLNRYPSYFR